MSLMRLFVKMYFEWDRPKAKINLKKHKVSFDEASTVFGDALSITVLDRAHSQYEERYVIVGRSSHDNILVVVYTDRNDKIRIISARKATRGEVGIYEKSQ